MGGVDRNDQLRKYYGVRLKSRKSYKYIFWFILDVAITNAFILLSNYSPIAAKLRSWKEFRAELAMSLIGDYNSRKVPGRQPSLPAPRSTNLTHFPLKMEKRSRCSYCNTSKIAKYTYWKCNNCINMSTILVICTQTASSNIINQLCNLSILSVFSYLCIQLCTYIINCMQLQGFPIDPPYTVS